MTDPLLASAERSTALALADTLISLADEVRVLRAEITVIEGDVDALTVMRDRVDHDRATAIAFLRGVIDGEITVGQARAYLATVK